MAKSSKVPLAVQALCGSPPQVSSRPASTSPLSKRPVMQSRWPRQRLLRGARPTCRVAPRSCSTCANWSMRIAKRLLRCSRQNTARCSATHLARSLAVSKTSSTRVAFRTCSRVVTASRPAAASMCTASSSRLVLSPVSRPSTSQQWCLCGCLRTPWRVATPSCSSQARRIHQRACSSPNCSSRPAFLMAVST